MCSRQLMARQPRALAYFYNADRTTRAIGSVLKNPAFAATLRKIAADGARAFYTGEIARDIVATANAHPTRPGAKDAGAKKKSASSSELYRKPGGIYTMADIKANGELPAMEKFKGMVHHEEMPSMMRRPSSRNKNSS